MINGFQCPRGTLFYNHTSLSDLFSLKNSMTNSTDTTAEWYVLRVTYQRELSTKEYLDKLNIENFVPIRVVRRRNSKGQFFRACEAAVHNYIFIRSTRGVIDELKTYKLPMLRYVMHPQNGENQIMVVPEEQMRNFIAVAGNEDEQVLFMSPEEVALSKGDKVRITGGVFEGVEGQLMRVKNSRGNGSWSRSTASRRWLPPPFPRRWSKRFDGRVRFFLNYRD